MVKVSKISVALASIALLLAAACTPTSTQKTETNDAQAVPPSVDTRALSAITARDIDQLFILPNINFKQYNALYFKPTEVYYDKQRRHFNTPFTAKDYQLNDKQLKHLHEVFVKTFSKKFLAAQELPLATSIDSNTLVVKATLHKLYFYAPMQDNVFVKTYLNDESSRMVLDIELTDGETGNTVLYSQDKKTTRVSNAHTQQFIRYSSIWYWTEIRNVFSTMARQLNKQI